MEVKIISPEGEVFRGKADAVFLPGADGGFELLDGHAPIVSTLAKGEVVVRSASRFGGAQMREDLVPDEKGEMTLEVSSGVAQAENDRVTILVD